MEKFGYPETLIREYQNWVVLLRPQQATLGALVLICKHEVDSFSKIGSESFAELEQITTDIEQNLEACFSYDKINYLMLMMVDREVHFHVLPRYAETCYFDQAEFKDPGWPGPPDLAHINKTGKALNDGLRHTLHQLFTG
jgi:diadenosine tetraphosphate (Ap4A) HIT family hydrolase